MFEQIIINLKQTGWTLEKLDENRVCATHPVLRRGLIFSNLGELPQDFKPLIRSYADFTQWDVIVFCPAGIDSLLLKQHRYPDMQLWYWDTQMGNLFPFPPTKDQKIPHWLRQIASGKPIDLESESQLKKDFVPFLTYIILGINLIVFILMGGSTDQAVLIAYGAKVNSLIQAGQIWRFLTSVFVHIGLIHLLFNLYALWVLGPLSERIFGHQRFFIIYILSGIGGSICSFIFTPALSAGASGAIFGLVGALLYYSIKRPYLWKSGLGINLILVVLVNFGIGLVQPGIDNFAHLGGLLTGTFTSIFLSKKMT